MTIASKIIIRANSIKFSPLRLVGRRDIASNIPLPGSHLKNLVFSHLRIENV